MWPLANLVWALVDNLGIALDASAIPLFHSMALGAHLDISGVSYLAALLCVMF